MDPSGHCVSKLHRSPVLILRNRAAAHGSAGVLVDKLVCIKQHDFARLYGTIPIRKRACLDREDYQLFIFIDGVSTEQCNAAANDSLILLGGAYCAVVSCHLGNATGNMNLDKASIIRKNENAVRLFSKRE